MNWTESSQRMIKNCFWSLSKSTKLPEVLSNWTAMSKEKNRYHQTNQNCRLRCRKKQTQTISFETRLFRIQKKKKKKKTIAKKHDKRKKNHDWWKEIKKHLYRNFSTLFNICFHTFYTDDKNEIQNIDMIMFRIRDFSDMNAMSTYVTAKEFKIKFNIEQDVFAMFSDIYRWHNRWVIKNEKTIKKIRTNCSELLELWTESSQKTIRNCFSRSSKSAKLSRFLDKENVEFVILRWHCCIEFQHFTF